MSERLPPLSALRTFEAAARHLSFTRAADELHVTQAAVSHQIRTLEEHLGVLLFRRLNRRLLLTDEGQLLMPSVRRAFDELTAGRRAGARALLRRHAHDQHHALDRRQLAGRPGRPLPGAAGPSSRSA